MADLNLGPHGFENSLQLRSALQDKKSKKANAFRCHVPTKTHKEIHL